MFTHEAKESTDIDGGKMHRSTPARASPCKGKDMIRVRKRASGQIIILHLSTSSGNNVNLYYVVVLIHRSPNLFRLHRPTSSVIVLQRRSSSYVVIVVDNVALAHMTTTFDQQKNGPKAHKWSKYLCEYLGKAGHNKNTFFDM